MSTKTYTLPPALEREAQKIARRNGVPVEKFIATAVSTLVGADKTYRETRRPGKMQARKRLVEILDKAPDVSPMPGDEIPDNLRASLRRLREKRKSRSN
jgi:hypothetical protein